MANEVGQMESADGFGKMPRLLFQRVTSHLRKNDPVDSIELDMLEQSLDVAA